MSSEAYANLQVYILGLFEELFYNREDCYAGMQPTKFAKRTIMNSAFVNNQETNKIIILSEHIGEKQNESRKLWMKANIPDSEKIEYLMADAGEDKFHVLERNEINWNLLIDDEIVNIRRMAEQTKELQNKEFLIPKFGYNKMQKDIAFLIEGRHGEYSYYNPF